MTKVRKSLYDARAAGALYSAAEIVAILVSFLFAVILAAMQISMPGSPYPDWYLYCSYLLPQFSFAIVIVLFFVFTEAKPKEVWRRSKWYYFPLALLLQFGLFSLSGVNNLFLQFLQDTIGYTASTSIPSCDGWKIVPVLLVIALLPAFFEETVFRGLMLTPMKKFSTPVAVLLSGALFALYHQSPAQTMYQFCCGCAFALMAIRANSVLPTMLSHFVNNAVIILLYVLGVEDFGIAFYVVAAVALVLSLVLLFLDKKTNTKKTESIKPFLLCASVGLVICGVMWIAQLLS